MTHEEEIRRLELAMLDLQARLEKAEAARLTLRDELDVHQRQLAVLESACRKVGLSWPPKDDNGAALRKFQQMWEYSARLIGTIAGAIGESNRIRKASHEATKPRSHEGEGIGHAAVPTAS